MAPPTALPNCALAIQSTFAGFLGFLVLGPLAIPVHAQADSSNRSPIEHLIVIVGENHSFDHVFATYQATRGQSIDNLLSKGIVNADGTPGPNFLLAEQRSAVVASPDKYQISPARKQR